MNTQIKNLLGLASILVLFLFVFAAFWYVAAYSRSILPERTFAVTGEGEVVVVPDVAEFTYTTVTEGELDLDVLQEANAEKINKANSFVKESGVDEKDIKTTNKPKLPRTIPAPQRAATTTPRCFSTNSVDDPGPINPRRISKTNSVKPNRNHTCQNSM